MSGIYVSILPSATQRDSLLRSYLAIKKADTGFE